MRPQYTPEQFAAAFWSKVNKTETCWYWTGAKDALGRGRVYDGDTGAYKSAHRVAYALTVGPVTPDDYVRQTCGNPLCMRPEHLVAESRYRPPTDTRRCPRCGETQPVDAYYISRKTGLPGGYCKPCLQAYGAERHAERYATDEEYREARALSQSTYQKQRYMNDSAYRAKQIAKGLTLTVRRQAERKKWK